MASQHRPGEGQAPQDPRERGNAGDLGAFSRQDSLRSEEFVPNAEVPVSPSQSAQVIRMPREDLSRNPFTQEEAHAMKGRAERGYKELESIFSGRAGYTILDQVSAGAELELVFVGDEGAPRFCGEEVFKKVNEQDGEGRFVKELGKHNGELNLSPQKAEGGFLTKMFNEIIHLRDAVNEAAKEHGAKVAFCGILPSLEAEHLVLDNMAKKTRYRQLQDNLAHMHDGHFESRVENVIVRGDTLMAESLNTSFQIHFQVPYDDYVLAHQISDMLAGPLLACATNSPFMAGHRGAMESRIPLWKGAIHPDRVSLSTSAPMNWLRNPLEQYRASLRHRFIVSADDPDTNKGATDLEHLDILSKTVYPWNRTTMHVDPDKKEASLRIEQRYVPGGPPIDCMANAALFFGAMQGYLELFKERKTAAMPSDVMDFSDADRNFDQATSRALAANMVWFSGETRPARELGMEIVAVAKPGLKSLGVSPAEIGLFLGVIEGRLETGLTGADVQLQKEEQLRKEFPDRKERMRALTRWYAEKTETGLPMHKWLLDDQPERPVH